ncbi:HesA/MoeB/ThiF family protein [soil metagenome]
MFTAEELIRYSRQIMMPDIGLAGQQRLKNAKVLVIGAGGLGCPLLQYLTASGVGEIGVIDFDIIEAHNLHRQILYAADDVGKLKATTASQKLSLLNSNTSFIVFDEILNEENAEKIIDQFDIIADGSDNFLTRYLVNDVCVKMNKPLVYGSILKFEGQLAVFNYQGSKNLRDIFAEAPDPADVPSCSETGVMGVVPGIIGTMMCDMVQKIIMKKEVPVNTLLVLDFNTYNFKQLHF